MDSVYDSIVETAEHTLPDDLRLFVSENYFIVIPIIIVLLVSLLSALHKVASEYTSFFYKHANIIVGAVLSWVIYLFSLDLTMRYNNVPNSVPLKDIFMDSYTVSSLLSIFTLFIMTIYCFGFMKSKKYGTSLVVCYSTFITATYCYFCGLKYADNWLFAISIVLNIAAAEFAIRLYDDSSSLLIFLVVKVLIPLWSGVLIPVGTFISKTLKSVFVFILEAIRWVGVGLRYIYIFVLPHIVAAVSGLMNIPYKALALIGIFLNGIITEIQSLFSKIGGLLLNLFSYSWTLLLHLVRISKYVLAPLYRSFVAIVVAASDLLHVIFFENCKLAYEAFTEIYAVSVLEVRKAIVHALQVLYIEVTIPLWVGLVLSYENFVEFCLYLYECVVWMAAKTWSFMSAVLTHFVSFVFVLWGFMYEHLLVPLYSALLELLVRGFSLLWSGLVVVVVIIFRAVFWLYDKLALLVEVMNVNVLQRIRMFAIWIWARLYEAAIWILSTTMNLIFNPFGVLAAYLLEKTYYYLTSIRDDFVHTFFSFIWKWGIAFIVLVFGSLFTLNGYNYYVSTYSVDVALVGYVLGAYINFVVFLLLASPYIPFQALSKSVEEYSKLLYNYLGFGIPRLVSSIIQSMWSFTVSFVLSISSFIHNLGQNVVKGIFNLANGIKALVITPLHSLLKQVWNNPMFSFVASCLSLVGVYYLWRYNAKKLVMTYGSSAFVALCKWFVNVQHSNLAQYLGATWAFIYNKKFMELRSYVAPQLTNALTVTAAWSTTALHSSAFSLANNYYFGYGLWSTHYVFLNYWTINERDRADIYHLRYISRNIMKMVYFPLLFFSIFSTNIFYTIFVAAMAVLVLFYSLLGHIHRREVAFGVVITSALGYYMSPFLSGILRYLAGTFGAAIFLVYIVCASFNIFQNVKARRGYEVRVAPAPQRAQPREPIAQRPPPSRHDSSGSNAIPIPQIPPRNNPPVASASAGNVNNKNLTAREKLKALPKPDHKFDDPECCICFEEYESKNEDCEVQYLCCGHKFHIHCVAGWVEENNKGCPICRDLIFQHFMHRVVA